MDSTEREGTVRIERDQGGRWCLLGPDGALQFRDADRAAVVAHAIARTNPPPIDVEPDDEDDVDPAIDADVIEDETEAD